MVISRFYDSITPDIAPQAVYAKLYKKVSYLTYYIFEKKEIFMESLRIHFQVGYLT